MSDIETRKTELKAEIEQMDPETVSDVLSRLTFYFITKKRTDKNKEYLRIVMMGLNKAIELAMKHVPKKPKEIHKSTFEQYEPSYAVCECGHKVGVKQKFCDECGQALEGADTDA